MKKPDLMNDQKKAVIWEEWGNGSPMIQIARAVEKPPATVDAITQELGTQPELNTGGGTSDGRFIAPLGTAVVELGLLNASIHQVDKYTPVDDLDALIWVYQRIMMGVLGS